MYHARGPIGNAGRRDQRARLSRKQPPPLGGGASGGPAPQAPRKNVAAGGDAITLATRRGFAASQGIGGRRSVVPASRLPVCVTAPRASGPGLQERRSTP